jgi:hypothetical protein
MEEEPPGKDESQIQSGLEARVQAIEFTLYCFSVIGTFATMYVLWI